MHYSRPLGPRSQAASSRLVQESGGDIIWAFHLGFGVVEDFSSRSNFLFDIDLQIKHNRFGNRCGSPRE
jgi:hypothetical protein